jgi:hypothetical protein
MRPLDEYVLMAAAAYLDTEDFKAGVLAEMRKAANESEPPTSADIAVLLDRKNALARMFAQGAITESQLVEGTREIEGKISALERRAVANGGNRAVVSLMMTDDPSAWFMAADVDVKREILRAVLDIELQRTGPHRGQFDPASVIITPRALLS